jgi:hypothetical protein
MILTGILRHYATVLLQSTPKKQPLAKIREQRSLLRGVNLRNNANVISPSAFQARKNYLVAAYKEGTFLADPEGRGKPPPNPMSDPAMMEGMMGMMKGNVAMMVPQTLIMGWINAFFSGFVISMSFSCFLLCRLLPCGAFCLPRQRLRFAMTNCRAIKGIRRVAGVHVAGNLPLSTNHLFQ